MNINETFIVPNWKNFSALWKKVCLILAGLLILLWLLGFGPGGRNCPDNAQAIENSKSTSNAPNNNETEGSNSNTNVDFLDYTVPAYTLKEKSEPAKVLFGLGSHDLPGNTMPALMPVLEKMSEDDTSVVVISGFHDASGDLAFNQVLAKKRAVAVREYLLELGLKSERLILEKPVKSVGSGDAAEARRVEASLAHLDS